MIPSLDAASIDFSLISFDDWATDPQGRPMGLHFRSDSGGGWALGNIPQKAADYGTNGVWTLSATNQVPEPEGMAYALPALLGLAAMKRRRIAAATAGH